MIVDDNLQVEEDDHQTLESLRDRYRQTLPFLSSIRDNFTMEQIVISGVWTLPRVE